MIDRNSKEVAKVLQAVNRVCTDKDKIDAIIADRITNQDVTDGFTRRGRPHKKLTAVNMDDFIDSVNVFNSRINRVYDNSSVDNFENPVLAQNNHILSSQADIFEKYKKSPAIFGVHSDSEDEPALKQTSHHSDIDVKSFTKSSDI